MSTRHSSPPPSPSPSPEGAARVTHTDEFVAIDAPEPEVVTEGRRTIRINGRPGEVSQIAPFTSTARRRRPPLTVEERLAGDPTRIIAWAVRARAAADPHRNPYRIERLRSQAPPPTLIKGKDAESSAPPAPSPHGGSQ